MEVGNVITGVLKGEEEVRDVAGRERGGEMRWKGRLKMSSCSASPNNERRQDSMCSRGGEAAGSAAVTSRSPRPDPLPLPHLSLYKGIQILFGETTLD